MDDLNLQLYMHKRRDSRCTCPDCTTDYEKHNYKRVCHCQQCTEYREANAPAPPTTPGGYTSRGFTTMDARSAYPTAVERNATYGKRQGKKMANLNICDTPDCNALLKGTATAQIGLCFSEHGDWTYLMLCPDCVAAVDMLLHNMPVEGRKRAYDKPYEGYKSTEDSDAVEQATPEQLAAALLTKLMKGQMAIDATVQHPSE